MSIAALASMLYATNLGYTSTQNLISSAEARTALASTASPASSPEALAKMDQALQFAGIQAQTNYLVSQAAGKRPKVA